MWRWAWVLAAVVAAGCGGSNLGKIDKDTKPLTAPPPPANFKKGDAPPPEGSPGKAPGQGAPKPVAKPSKK